MAISSVGYAGTVDAAQWADLVWRAGGSEYGVVGFGDWRVSVGGGTRQVSVAAGKGWGHGVVDSNSAPVVLTHSSVPSGQRWDLIVAHRNWNTNTTTFAIVAGGSAKVIPARDSDIGDEADQPIALVRINAGATTVAEIVDLRCIPGDNGMVIFDALSLSYLSAVGTEVRLDDIVWSRVVDNLGSPRWIQSDQGDTGWVSSLAGVDGTASFDADSMRLRRLGARVTGHVVVKRNSTADPATAPVAADGSITPGSLLRLPVGWRPGAKCAVEVRGYSGNAPFFGTVETDGLVTVTHGLAGNSMTLNSRYYVHFDHLVS